MTELEHHPNTKPDRFPFYRLSVRQFVRMIDAGIFPKHVRVE